MTPISALPDPDPGAADLDLPPLAGGAPQRLIVLLPGAGSTPGQLVTAAVAWQLKFRTARAVLLAAPFVIGEGAAGAPAPLAGSGGVDVDVDEGGDVEVEVEVDRGGDVPGAGDVMGAADVDGDASTSPPTPRRYWTDPATFPVEPAAIRGAALAVADRIRDWQARSALGSNETILVGFSQGASLALELAFEPDAVAAIIVAFAPRLYRLPVDGDRIGAAVHLIHGRYDSVVPLVHGEAALRRLGAVSSGTSLDVVEDGGHVVDQDQLNVATQRVMQTLFASRRENGDGALH